MQKIIAFSGSNNSQSINQKLIKTTARLSVKARVEILDIRDYPSPFYSADYEKESGIPENIQRLFQKLQEADGYIISSPEHNGSMPAYFKNTIDWLSRINTSIFGDKPVLLMSTSPGRRGGETNQNNLKGLMKWWGANVISSFKLSNFYDKFENDKLNHVEEAKLKERMQVLEAALV